MRTVDELDELTGLVCDHPELYVRYSHGPEHDASRPSRDYESGLDMPGLSVTPLRPESWWTRPAADWVARRICKYLDLARNEPDRRPWLLSGEIVGHGPDHEPLVASVTPVAWVGDAAVEQARRRYHERFDVGRDSTG